jgi:hypothetical protein
MNKADRMKKHHLPLWLFVVLGGIAAALSLLPRARAQTTPAKKRLLSGVASIVEADIVGARYVYDDTYGPRTIATLSNIKVLAGTAIKTTEISQLGGPLPSGDIVTVAELPVLTPKSHHILFLMDGPWYFTPIWAGLAFRVERISGRDIVMTNEGHPVLSFSSRGVGAGNTQLLSPRDELDPLQPASVLTTANISAADVGAALDRSSFLTAAIQTVTADGGLSPSASVSSTPIVNGRWGVLPTSQPTP